MTGGVCGGGDAMKISASTNKKELEKMGFKRSRKIRLMLPKLLDGISHAKERTPSFCDQDPSILR